MTTRPPRLIPILADSSWQMSYGERAALEGLVAQLKPRIALEIGTAGGGSLRCIASHSYEVHSVDLIAPPAELRALTNVRFHTGDSRELVPQVLDDLASDGGRVDFVLIDGDHSADGVRQDIENVLRADSVQSTVILMHDTMNEVVREGIERSAIEDHPKVVHLDLDFVPGYLARHSPYKLQLWGGIGIAVVDAQAPNVDGPVRQDRFHELFSIVRPARDMVVEAGGLVSRDSFQQVLRHASAGNVCPEDAQLIAALRERLDRSDRTIQDMQSSLSWRLSRPLRSIKRSVISRRSI